MPTSVSVSSDPQASPFRPQVSPQQQVPPLPAQGERDYPGYRSQSQSHSESSDYMYQQDHGVSSPKVLVAVLWIHCYDLQSDKTSHNCNT